MRLVILPNSSNARKVMTANDLLGLDIPLTIVDLRSGAQKTPRFWR